MNSSPDTTGDKDSTLNALAAAWAGVSLILMVAQDGYLHGTFEHRFFGALLVLFTGLPIVVILSSFVVLAMAALVLGTRAGLVVWLLYTLVSSAFSLYIGIKDLVACF